MSVELNHTIVHARDNRESAEFFADLLGLEITAKWGPFVAVDLSNHVTLDFATIPADRITPQHYADPHRKQPGAINHHDGGHGVYFVDPAGHLMELITVPYGGRPS
ncbi:VOC family protein [Streptomyces sp. NPDC088553]|uniref:VOC family protein n=1 Tax=Streptomyces sp. NPDC088553 TaxID=3365864 RepID=UPI00382889CB